MNNQIQKKNSFDSVTLQKIKKSFFWALSGPIGVAILDLAVKAPRNTWWGVLIAYGLPVLLNAVREYKKGETERCRLIYKSETKGD